MQDELSQQIEVFMLKRAKELDPYSGKTVISEVFQVVGDTFSRIGQCFEHDMHNHTRELYLWAADDAYNAMRTVLGDY